MACFKSTAMATSSIVILTLLSIFQKYQSIETSVNLDSQTDFFETSEILTAQDCPTLQVFNTTIKKCVCLNDVDTLEGTVTCNSRPTSAKIMNTHCLTFSETNNTYELGSCIFNTAQYGSSKRSSVLYTQLPPSKTTLNHFTCGQYNREGRLCGNCINNTFPLAYSYQLKCIVCDNVVSNIFKYILAAFGPLTVFFAIIVCFNINVTTSYLHGFVIFSQIVTMPSLMRLYSISDIESQLYHSDSIQVVINLALNLYSMWNLDFFRFFYTSICLKLDPIQVLTLDYVLAIYPLCLTVLVFTIVQLHAHDYKLVAMICKPFTSAFAQYHKHDNIKRSLIDTFATFFLLSIVKFINVSFDLLIPVTVYILGYNNSTTVPKVYALYFDPKYDLFKDEHLPYAILALLMLVIFVAFPIVLMLLYSTCLFHSFINHVPIPGRIVQTANTFVDKFQGNYRNGTESDKKSCDCRCFAALFLILRVLIFLAISLTESTLCFVVVACLLYGYAIILIVVQPYKKSYYKRGIIDTVCILLLALGVTVLNCTNIATVKDQNKKMIFIFIGLIVIISPCVCFVCVVVYKVFAWLCSRVQASF